MFVCMGKTLVDLDYFKKLNFPKHVFSRIWKNYKTLQNKILKTGPSNA